MKQEVIETNLASVLAAPPMAPKGEEMLLLREKDLRELSAILGRNIKDSDDLKLAARNMSTLSIKGLDGGDLVLDTYLLNRLRSRCHPSDDFPKWVRDRIVELLAGFCGA